MEFVDKHINLEEYIKEKEKCSNAADDSSEKAELLQRENNVSVPKSKAKPYQIKLGRVDLALIQEVQNHPCLYAGKLQGQNETQKRSRI